MMTVQELFDAVQQLNLTKQIRLASQIMQSVAQKMQLASSETPQTPQSRDPLIGLFSGSPDLATHAEEILAQELHSTSGFSWKECLWPYIRRSASSTQN